MNMTIVNHIHNTVITSVAKTAQSVFRKTLILLVIDNFLSPSLLSSRCFVSPVDEDGPWDETDPLFYEMYDDATNF